MNDDGTTQPETADLALKIARLIEERGWNQTDFARITNLNQQTIRLIVAPSGDRRLRNATVRACAQALGLTVHELRNLPLERLLPRMHSPRSADSPASQRRLYEEATQPELLGWIERNPERANQLSPEEVDELLSLQGTGGPLTAIGVQHYVEVIERKRGLVQKVHTIAGTEYIDLLEQFIDLLYEKVQPYPNKR